MTIKRAIEVLNNLYAYYDDPDTTVEALTIAIDTLKKVKSGKIIEPLCKVGDTVYQTDTVGERIYPSKIKNIIFDTDSGFAFDKTAIGKTVFLTRKEVEKKLKENNE